MLINTLGAILAAGIGVLHFYVLFLEMFRWDTAGPRVFGMTREQVPHTRFLAANLGLYNGFLGGGLLWGVSQGATGLPVLTYFLSCVVIAGLYAARRLRKTFWVQTCPAVLALACLWVGRP
jgi:putative membrane protein